MEVVGYAIGFFSLIITGLTGVLTYLAWRNGRWMKQAHGDTQALIRETHEKTQALIKATHEETMEVIRKIDRTIERLGELIVADGERTRELVRQLKP